MLAGIYYGDWGVDPTFVDTTKSREHLVKILAHWEGSSQAAFVKRQLRWDEEKGQNRFEHIPRENALTVAGML